jgi:16S rRNA processing protein RimM
MPVWKLDDGLRLGKVLKPNGYLGIVKVAFFMSELVEALEVGSFIFIEWMEKPVPYMIEEIVWDDAKTARIKLADVNSEEDAKKLIGREVLISEKTIPEEILDQEDESDLIGYKVIDTEKVVLGEVTGLDESGIQSLLEVTNNGKEFLIPVHEDLIKKIDSRKRVITVDLPDGLLEL